MSTKLSPGQYLGDNFVLTAVPDYVQNATDGTFFSANGNLNPTLQNYELTTNHGVLAAKFNAPLVTDVGGNAAVLGDSLRHCLVPPEDPAALAAAWSALLLNAASRAEAAAEARNQVITSFSLQAMVRRYQELYQGRDVTDGLP